MPSIIDQLRQRKHLDGLRRDLLGRIIDASILPPGKRTSVLRKIISDATAVLSPDQGLLFGAIADQVAATGQQAVDSARIDEIFARFHDTYERVANAKRGDLYPSEVRKLLRETFDAIAVLRERPATTAPDEESADLSRSGPSAYPDAKKNLVASRNGHHEQTARRGSWDGTFVIGILTHRSARNGVVVSWFVDLGAGHANPNGRFVAIHAHEVRGGKLRT